MLSQEFDPQEHLFRAISLVQYDTTEKKASTAAFKDSLGVSVDRQGGRTIEECRDYILGKEKFKDSKLIVHFTVEVARSHGTEPHYKPLEDNPYHSILIRQDGTIKLSDSTRKRLKESAIECYSKPED